METLSPNSAILEKTRELCSLILQSGEYQENVAKIDAFFKDDDAQASYREFAQLGEELHKKQHDGALEQSDIEGYETKLAALKADPITGAFMGAEENLNGIVQQVSKQVGKTLELGRLPEPEDLQDSGCCSSGGCGCD
ncbi:YlbF family regulator [Verrucomicrobiales bacterium BCK34]|nr:YlbF family regulator [Verrucomicrobiales bacterium BCK34]